MELLEEFFNWCVSDITKGFTNIVNAIDAIDNYLNPNSDNFIFKIAFVPQEDDFFIHYFDDIKIAFDNKLPVVSAIYSFFDMIIHIVYSDIAPDFEVTMPACYGGGTYTFIDFRMFDEYRVFILNFIRFPMWFFFIKNIYKKLPTMVYR